MIIPRQPKHKPNSKMLARQKLDKLRLKKRFRYDTLLLIASNMTSDTITDIGQLSLSELRKLTNVIQESSYQSY